MIQVLTKLFFISLISSLLLSCESNEDDLLFQAEHCINENSETSKISECQQFLTTLSSARANTLNCKIKLEMSGLSNQKISEALDIMEESDTNNKEANFMGLVSLNSLTDADETAKICTNTESPGLEFIADSARMGTYFADQISRLGDISPENPLTESDLTDMLDNCNTSSGCKEVIGVSAESMFDIYCNNSSTTDVQVCDDVNAAILNGQTSEEIGQELIDLLLSN